MKITRVTTKAGRYYYIQDLEARNPRTGRPQQKWHKLTRVDEGEAALHAALAELLGKPAERVGTMPALIEAFSRDHFKTLSVGVRGEYERMFGKISTAFRQFDATDVLPGDVLQFLNNNFAATPTMRHHYKGRLSTFFAWCVLHGHLAVNPCREIRLPLPPKRKGVLTPELFWKLHDALPPMLQCFLELLYYTKQRPTEIRLLRESQISPDRIHFTPTKTSGTSGEQVEVKRTPAIDAVLDRARALRAEIQRKRKVITLRDDHIIQPPEGGLYSADRLHKTWWTLRRRAGLPNINTRHVRPFALSMMELQGYDLREIRKAAAHTRTSTTEGYLEQHRDRLSDAPIPLPERPKT